MTIVIDVNVPDEKYYYLAGPMTNYPQHNFPRFKQVAAKLRGRGLVICSPADLDAPIYEEVMRGDGTQPHLRSDADIGLDLLRRDVNIVMHPNCIGIICLEGWENSFGADIETFIGDKWGRKLLHYYDDGDNFTLVEFSRAEALAVEGRTEPRRKVLVEGEFVPIEDVPTEPHETVDADSLGALRRVRELPPRDLGTLGPIYAPPIPERLGGVTDGRGHHESDREYEQRRRWRPDLTLGGRRRAV